MSEIADKLIDWYGVNGRNLPWRRTRDPYRIWLSEVILQQTRIAQGMDYYLRFVARFPDVGALAAADEDEVLKLWQGLGYYSRARNLHAAARAGRRTLRRAVSRPPMPTCGRSKAWATIRRRPSARSPTTRRAPWSTAMSTACCHGSSTSIWPSTPPRAAKRSPRLPTNNSTGVGLHATTRRSWISARCNARRQPLLQRLPAAGRMSVAGSRNRSGTPRQGGPDTDSARAI